MKRPRHQGYCCYCKRQLTPAEPERSTSLTRDHVNAVCLGGGRWVPCCRKCNMLKGDLGTADWFWFIDTHPRWWKRFDTNEQVKRVVREFRFAQAMARKAQLEREEAIAEARARRAGRAA